MSLFPRKTHFPSLPTVPASVGRYSRRIAVGVLVLMLAAPLFNGGGLQAFVLNAVGLAFAGWFVHRCRGEWERGRRRRRRQDRSSTLEAPVAPRRRGSFIPGPGRSYGRSSSGKGHPTASTTRATRKAQEHQEAVALLEELAAFLRVPMHVVRDLARRVTGKPWEQLDMAGAEATTKVLSEALHRVLLWQADRIG